MPTSNQRNQAISEMAQAVIAGNQELKTELASLITDLVKHQRKVMKHGTPQEKSMLVKAVLPQMLAAMGSVAQTEQEAEERAAYDTMRAVLRGEQPAEALPQALKVVNG